MDQSFTMETPGWIKLIADKVKGLFSWIPDLWGWLKDVFKWFIIVIVIGIILSISVKCLICCKGLCKLCNYKVDKKRKHERQMYASGYDVYNETQV